MSNKSTTKRALALSVISMLICVVMLAGTTFAWFTDSVQSGRNVIAAGNLDVELYHNGTDDVKDDTALFTDVNGESILWEPGVVAYENFTVKNVGTLALKYQLDLTIFDEQKTPDNKSLSDVIKVAYVEGGVTGTDRNAIVGAIADDAWVKIADIADSDTLYPVGNADNKMSEKTTGVVLYWEPTEKDNDYNMNNDWQGEPDLFIEFGLTLVATQLEYEEDSFDETYDADAKYPVIVNNANEFKTALAAGGNIILNQDIVVDSTTTIAAGKESKIDLNGNDISYEVANSGASAIINNKGNLEIVGEGKISYVAANPDLQEIPTYATNTITNTGSLTIGKGVVVSNASAGGASYAVDVQSGSFVLDGGTLEGDRCALRIARFNADTSFVMNSGLVTAKTPAWIHLPGSDSAKAPAIDVTINGGKMVTTKATSADNDVLYTYSFGNSHANTNVTINGGEFLGGTVSIGSGYKGDAPTMTITGGTFEYDVLKWTSDTNSEVIFAANK